MHRRRWTTRPLLTVALLLFASSARGDDPAWSEQAGLEFWSGSRQLPPPHLVIRAPGPPPSQAAPRRTELAHGLLPGSHHSLHASVDSGHAGARHGDMAHGTAFHEAEAQGTARVAGPRGTSPDHEAHRRGHWWQKKPAPPTIPGAVVEPVWRSPYSYGYFGAGRHRHWQRHYGARQSYTQWTLK